MKKNWLSAATHRRGFTLIELLVVIAIIAILASLLMPVLAKAKEQGMRARCIGNIKQILLATQMYVTDNTDWMPYTSWSSGTFNVPNWCYTRIATNNPTHMVEQAVTVTNDESPQVQFTFTAATEIAAKQPAAR